MLPFILYFVIWLSDKSPRPMQFQTLWQICNKRCLSYLALKNQYIVIFSLFFFTTPFILIKKRQRIEHHTILYINGTGSAYMHLVEMGGRVWVCLLYRVIYIYIYIYIHIYIYMYVDKMHWHSLNFYLVVLAALKLFFFF